MQSSGFKEHLKPDKGKSVVSEYEDKQDAQSIYCELKKHAKSSTAAQISGDSLFKYITSAQYPGNWRGTSYAFVLHWKEQVTQYQKLELEDIPLKQKLRMLQNTVTDIVETANVKQLSDQIWLHVVICLSHSKVTLSCSYRHVPPMIKVSQLPANWDSRMSMLQVWCMMKRYATIPTTRKSFT
jgi:hypothetical protein